MDVSAFRFAIETLEKGTGDDEISHVTQKNSIVDNDPGVEIVELEAGHSRVISRSRVRASLRGFTCSQVGAQEKVCRSLP